MNWVPLQPVKRGFLLQLVEWARKRKTFTVAQAVEEFNGRQINSRKVDATRCARYFNYCRVHGIFKLVKDGGTNEVRSWADRSDARER